MDKDDIVIFSLVGIVMLGCAYLGYEIIKEYIKIQKELKKYKDG